MKLFKLD